MQTTTSKKSTKSLNPIQRYWQFVTSENFGHAGPYPVLHPDVFWYRFYGMGAQKSSCNTFSIYISCKNLMKYSLGILKNKNLFMRHKYPSPKTFLDTQLQPSGFSDITKPSKP